MNMFDVNFRISFPKTVIVGIEVEEGTSEEQIRETARRDAEAQLKRQYPIEFREHGQFWELESVEEIK